MYVFILLSTSRSASVGGVFRTPSSGLLLDDSQLGLVGRAHGGVPAVSACLTLFVFFSFVLIDLLEAKDGLCEVLRIDLLGQC